MAAFSSTKPGDGPRIEPHFRAASSAPTDIPPVPGLGRPPPLLTQSIAGLKATLGMELRPEDTEPAVQNGWSHWLRRIRLGPRGAADLTREAGRSRVYADIVHIAHEGSHHLVNVIGKPLQHLIVGSAAELGPFDLQGTAAPSLSAFAHFWRDYILKPDQAAVNAPRFYQAFEDLLDAERPGILEDLDRLQRNSLSKDFQDYVKALRVADEKELDPTVAPARSSRSARETSMSPNVLAAAILAVSIIVASAVFAGRYSMSDRPSGTNSVYILDRFTGQVRRCTFECEELSTQPK